MTRISNDTHKMIGQLFAGAGLGLLVGILVGLSSSPVVSTVVGALAAGMITLLGFVRPSKDGESSYAEGSVVRLGSFGLACTAAVLFGLFIRTHNLLSPSISEQIGDVRNAGYTDEEAHRWVAYRNIGIATGSSSEKSHPADGSASVAGSVLFSSANSGECQYFDTNRYQNTKEHLYALQQLGGKYAEYAAKISSLDPSHQKTVLDSLRLLFCPQ